jgi:hypothetical protein
MHLESQQVLRHEIETIAAVEGEPCPQRVAALCPEARKVEQSHDVVRLQRRAVKRRACVGLVVLVGLAVRADHPSSRTAALGAPCHRLSWPRSGVGSAADARKRTGADSLSHLGTFPRKYSWLAFSEQMHEAGTGLVGRCGAETSFAASVISAQKQL